MDAQIQHIVQLTKHMIQTEFSRIKESIRNEKQKKIPEQLQLKAKNIEEVDYAQINALQKLKITRLLYKLLTQDSLYL